MRFHAPVLVGDLFSVYTRIVRTGRTSLLVLGVVGSLVAAELLLATTFSGALSSLAVTIIGLAIVIGTVVRTRRL